MKKLRLSVEELSVETFGVDVSLRGREGTVAGQAAGYTSLYVAPGARCYLLSERPNVAMCAPTIIGEEYQTGEVQCGVPGTGC